MNLIILCAGPSISELSAKISLFDGIDTPYLLINGYEQVYKDTFGRLGRYPKYVSVYTSKSNHAGGSFQEFIDNGVEFLTNELSYTEVFRAKVPKYTVIEPDVDRDYPLRHTNSIVKLIVYMYHRGYRRMFIYGCDGPGVTTHYKWHKPNNVEDKIKEAQDINERMPGIMMDYGMQAEIYNCNPDSKIICFPRITIEESVDGLQSDSAEFRRKLQGQAVS